MSPLELFRFMFPLFAAVTDEGVEQALALSAAYRPACLTATQQDEAQVLYAAWLLYLRAVQNASVAGGASGGVVSPWLASEKEGDLARSFRAGGTTAGQVDPYGFLSRYQALAAICGGGAITVGHGHAPCCC